MMHGVVAYWVSEKPVPSPTYCDVDGQWSRSVSHWGPVIRTGILVVGAGAVLAACAGPHEITDRESIAIVEVLKNRPEK